MYMAIEAFCQIQPFQYVCLNPRLVIGDPGSGGGFQSCAGRGGGCLLSCYWLVCHSSSLLELPVLCLLCVSSFLRNSIYVSYNKADVLGLGLGV